MSAAISLPLIDPARRPASAATARTHRERRLIDSHGRTIAELRLSVTDRCNFRCVYCMDPDVRFAPEDQLLSVEEMLRVGRAAVALGVRAIRLTGGEPTLHPQLEEIIAGVAGLGVDDISMTTNGSLATRPALARWKAAGLKRITFSLDSASPELFERMTRSRTPMASVLAAIDAAAETGLTPVKVNAVVIRGRNEGEIPGLVALARRHRFQIRFIEYMPLDSGHHWNPSLLVPADEILERAGAAAELTPLGRDGPSSTSEDYALTGDPQVRVGVIAPVTRPFCGQCSRLRVTADGKVRPCLFSLHEHDLRGALRSGQGDEMVESALLDAVWAKQAGHGISAPGFRQPDRPMSAIGG